MEDNFKERISKYTLRELLDVEASLDKERAPDKYALLKEEIALRRATGEYVPRAYACPHCRKRTISHCNMQNSTTFKCSECGEQLYLDPNRSSITSWIGFILFGLAVVYESGWFILIALIALILLRDKWAAFVSKDVYSYRLQTVEIVTLISFALISILLTLLFVFSDPSYVGPYRPMLIAVCALSTIVLSGVALHRYKQMKTTKN